MDIRTLVVMLGIAHVVHVLALSLQASINRTYRGIGWWLVWSATAAAGFVAMLLRQIPSTRLVFIAAQNSLIVIAVTCLYIGIVRFLDARARRFIIGPIVAVFFLTHLYFTWVDDNIAARGVSVSLTLAAIAFLSAQTLFVNKTTSISAAAGFTAAILLGHGLVFLYRAAAILAGASASDFFAPTLFNALPFLDGIVVSTLWTFGLIIMVNQRLNAEMAEARERFELLFNTNPDAVVITRASDGFCSLVNEGFVTLSGFARPEVLGHSILSVPLYEDPTDRQNVVNELRQAGFVTNVEIPFRRKDGSRFVGSMSARVFSFQGLPHILSVTRDITERTRQEEEKALLEAENRQLQKAESLGRMAGAIAHHFNNKLQAVMAKLELARLGLQPEQRSHAHVADAMQAARQAAEVSGLMLTYLGQSRGKREPLDLSEACRRDLLLLQAAWPRNAVLSTDLPSPGPIIHANANLMQQVLTNLVTNAWEAVGNGNGRVHLSVRTVSRAGIQGSKRFPIGWQPEDEVYACIEVADEGCGIAEADLDRVFDPFFSSKLVGRGLGLAVTLGIVRAHHGGITVESTPGEGSVFRVFVPVSDQGPPAPEPRPEQMEKTAE